MQGFLRRLSGMEAVELMVMESEYHKLPVLRAECCIGPNAALATNGPPGAELGGPVLLPALGQFTRYGALNFARKTTIVGEATVTF